MRPPLRPPPIAKALPRPWRQAVGSRAYRQGHGAEWTAALWLMLKGYQIMGFRMKTRCGEIDILARRGRTLVVVEVKRRTRLNDALLAVTERQYRRLLQAGEAVLRNKPSLNDLELRIDLVALAPGRWPRHIKGLVRG